jgi:hypothetical protein
MAKLQLSRALCALAILGGISVSAGAQQSAPPAETPATPRAEPKGPEQPRTDPGTPTTKAPAVKPSEAPAEQSFIGLNVFSADGTRVGEVKSVNTGPGGDVVGLHIRTGGFLGFGGRIVAVPEGRFIRSGQSIRLDLDADQVETLPEVKD